MTVSIVPTASMQAKASILLADQASWSRGRSKQTGTPFWLIPGSKGSAHYTTSYGCTCRSFAHRGVCSHLVAVQIHEQRRSVTLSAPEAAPTVMDAPRRASYEELFLACPCGDVAEARDGLCDRCASDREWQQRQDRRRQLLANQ
jgi:hypothetical protein